MRLALILLATGAPLASAALSTHERQLMVCHRTADRDFPENTLEAIRESKTLGCDIVEMDISRTLDGALVLLHDGPIDRVSSGSGEVEKMLSSELALYDAGSWFHPRFTGIRHPRFLDALRLAKDLGLKLELDLKTRGIVRQVYEMVQSEGMLERVSFGGHAEELPQVAPDWRKEPTASWKPDMEKAAVARLQKQGKFVIASFSANDHELDFALTRRAVAAGVDAISTDHPRLAAEALGCSIESPSLIPVALHLQKEMYTCWSGYAKPSKSSDLSKARTTFERPDPSRPGAPAQTAQATELYRAYQNVLRAMESLPSAEATRWLQEEALRTASDFSGIGASWRPRSSGIGPMRRRSPRDSRWRIPCAATALSGRS